MKLIYALLIVSLAGCAKNSLDIVNDGKPMGVFEPKKDYVVDIPMGSSKVSGESSGIEILGIFTIGASEQAEGVDITNRGDSTLGSSASSGGFAGLAFVTGALSPVSDLFQDLLDGSAPDFKAAALRLSLIHI